MKISDIWKIKVRKKINKINLDEDGLYLALTILIGIAAGVLAVGINKTIVWLSHVAGTLETPTLLSVSLGTLFIFISGYITTRYVPETSGSGIPQTKIHFVVDHGIIKFKEWFVKIITSILSLSSGITLGTEGPTVVVCSGFASSIGSLFSLSKTRIKGLLAIGSAAGIAATFNTPIAAVTFTLEEIVGNMNTRSLGPVIVSSVAAAVTSKVLQGGASTFSVLKYKFEDPQELLFYLVVGILAALIGPIWVKTVMYLRQLRISLFKGHYLTYILTVFVLLMGFAMYDSQILGSGHHTINEALLSNFTSFKVVIYFFVIKFIFISLCYSSGISGGLFLPTLFMGAMIGSFVGLIASQFYPDSIQIGAFALVGMGAYFATVIRAPFTSILMIFEMTQDYRIMLPLMIANVTAYIISSKLIKGSIYELLAEQDGVHLPDKEDADVLEQLTVEQAMIKNVFTLDSKATVKESMLKMNKTIFTGFPIFKKKRLFGIVSKNQVATAIADHHEDVELDKICTTQLITIYPDQSLLLALHYLEKFKISHLLVVSRLNHSTLKGIITAHDIVENFGLHIQEDNTEDENLSNIINNIDHIPAQDNQE